MRVPMLVAGAFGAGLVTLNVAARLPSLYQLGVLVPALLVTAGLAATAGVVYSRRAGSPYPARLGDILDVVLVLAVAPVALGVLGFYNTMLDFKL
jgi:hypothetical protein